MIPENYGIIEKNIYRCSTIQQNQFSIFKNIKTVLLLSQEQPTKYLLNWISDHNINLFHLGLQIKLPVNSWRPVSEELIKEGLEILLDDTLHPVLVMCTTGVQETGALVGCLRKLQDWNYNSIIVEYRAFAGNKSRYAIEQFIELFDTDLVVLPNTLPPFYKVHLEHCEREKQACQKQ